MSYERFSQLWKALVTDRAREENCSALVAPLCNGMRRETSDALTSYAKGDRSAIDEARLALANLSK